MKTSKVKLNYELWLMTLILIAFGCSSDDNSEPTNRPPESFDLIEETENADDVEPLATFTWGQAIDPDGDPVTYDLFIDEREDPTRTIADDFTGTSFTLQERLLLHTSYNWRVIASDDQGNSTTSNQTFSFTTRGLSDATSATLNANFIPRFRHTSVVFDNKLWIIGGSDTTIQKNDVWSSNDGASWTQSMIPGVQFTPRAGHTSVVFDNKIWVIGGIDLFFNNDVWYSSDGINWKIATPSAPTAQFSKRFSHASVVYDNKIWVIGGRDSAGYRNDVWYSTDGANWTEATSNADFSPRADHAVTVFDDAIWVIGGDDSDETNDVWKSTDGITWTRAVENAAFSERAGHSAIAFEDKLWLFGGREDGAGKSDTWYSKDGIEWTLDNSNQGYSARNFHTTQVLDNKIWLIGGFEFATLKNDVWYMD